MSAALLCQAQALPLDMVPTSKLQPGQSGSLSSAPTSVDTQPDHLCLPTKSAERQQKRQSRLCHASLLSDCRHTFDGCSHHQRVCPDCVSRFLNSQLLQVSSSRVRVCDRDLGEWSNARDFFVDWFPLPGKKVSNVRKYQLHDETNPSHFMLVFEEAAMATFADSLNLGLQAIPTPQVPFRMCSLAKSFCPNVNFLQGRKSCKVHTQRFHNQRHLHASELECAPVPANSKANMQLGPATTTAVPPSPSTDQLLAAAGCKPEDITAPSSKRHRTNSPDHQGLMLIKESSMKPGPAVVCPLKLQAANIMSALSQQAPPLHPAPSPAAEVLVADGGGCAVHQPSQEAVCTSFHASSGRMVVRLWREELQGGRMRLWRRWEGWWDKRMVRVFVEAWKLEAGASRPQVELISDSAQHVEFIVHGYEGGGVWCINVSGTAWEVQVTVDVV